MTPDPLPAWLDYRSPAYGLLTDDDDPHAILLAMQADADGGYTLDEIMLAVREVRPSDEERE